MIVALLFLYYGLPIILASILAAILHLPFRWLRDDRTRFRKYLWFRVALTILGPVAMLVFKLAGGYDNIQSSEFSPIGTDEWGVAVHVVSHTIVAFAIISFIELIRTAGNHHEPPSEKEQGENSDHIWR